MAKRAHPLTLGVRVNDRELSRVDAAARLRGLSRSEYLRKIVLPQAECDLRSEVGAAVGETPVTAEQSV